MILRKSVATVLGCAILLLGAYAKQQVDETAEKIEVVARKWTTNKVVYNLDRGVGRGRVVKVSDAKEGFITETYRLVRDEKGEVTEKVLINSKRIEAQPAIYKMGHQGYSTSRGSFVRDRVVTMKSTAYTPDAGRGKYATGRTKMGIPARYGVIAVDPRVIPLGTYVFVEGYGFAYACDIGGAIKGNIIDVCVPTNREARNWGRRKVKVHVFRR